MQSSQLTASPITEESVTAALKGVRYPGLNRDLVTFGMVDGVSICGTLVKVRLAANVGGQQVVQKDVVNEQWNREKRPRKQPPYGIHCHDARG